MNQPKSKQDQILLDIYNLLKLYFKETSTDVSYMHNADMEHSFLKYIEDSIRYNFQIGNMHYNRNRV
jgi:hypothetical protein